jgi:hypothetical protein
MPSEVCALAAGRKEEEKDLIKTSTGDLVVIAWSCNRILTHGKDLELSLLLAETHADVAIISKTEIPAGHAMFAVAGYAGFTLMSTGKTRIIILISNKVATLSNPKLVPEHMSGDFPSVWIKLGAHRVRDGDRVELRGAVLLGGVYRQWSDAEGPLSAAREKEQLDLFLSQVQTACESAKSVIVAGDMNLDSHRLADPTYTKRTMSVRYMEAMEAAGLYYHKTPNTFRSYGQFEVQGEYVHKYLCLDHVFSTGNKTNVRVSSNPSTDHSTLVATVSAIGVRQADGLKIVRIRNFKKLHSADLETALETRNWGKIYQIHNVNDALDYLVTEITAALNLVAPFKDIKVRTGKALFFAADTLLLMQEQDSIKSKGKRYHSLRNRCSLLIERDKRHTNEQILSDSRNAPRVLWDLANDALGKARPTLPAFLDVDGSTKVGSLEAAEAMNKYFGRKIHVLRADIADAPAAEKNDWPPGKPRAFFFNFCIAVKIKKIIKGLSSTNALGVDGIPTIFLKMGVEVAHVINRSLASGCVPSWIKKGVVRPIHKGAGKCKASPASYRPVCVLTALLKVLETTVKWDLNAHLNATNGIPTMQHGFCSGHSCSTALGSAHAGWLQGVQAGKFVGLLGFDLSSAFDTLHPDTLTDKLKALNITGRALSWYRSYLTGGEQCVEWEGVRSCFKEVAFGVRQGSILGPVLFLVHTANTADAVGTRLNVTYADDSNVWVAAGSLVELKVELEKLAQRFSRWAKGNGLAMNASKTQLLVSSNTGNVDDFTVMVDGK